MITMVFYLAFYCFGLIKALLGKPIWGLYVYFFCFYFHAPSQYWGESLPDIRWSLISVLFTVAALCVYPPKRSFRFWRYTENKLIFIYAFFVIAQTAWVGNPELHFEYVILLVKFICLIFLVQNIVHTVKDVKGIIWINVLGAAFLSYYGMTQTSNGRMENFGNGAGLDSNLAGMYFATILVMGGYLLLEKFHKKQLILMFAMGIVMMGLFMTESRGALIALGITGVVGIVFRPQTQQKKFIGFGALAIIAGLTLTGPQIIERFQGMKKDDTGEMEDSSAESRMVIINSQIEMFKVSPIIGQGHRSTLLLSTQYIPEQYMTQNNGLRSSHNITMAILVDHGLIGFVLYFGAIITALLRIFSYKYPLSKEKELAPEQQTFSHVQLACILALLCFMIAGQGANNKKLEADIWLLALIPLLAGKVKEEKLAQIKNSETQSKNP